MDKYIHINNNKVTQRRSKTRKDRYFQKISILRALIPETCKYIKKWNLRNFFIIYLFQVRFADSNNKDQNEKSSILYF